MKSLVVRLVRETEGQDLIEYAFLSAVLGLTIVASFNALQNNITAIFNRIRGVLLVWS